MTLDRDRPEILTPPEHPPACCTQQTITVPPEVAAKTRQKHDYPSARNGGSSYPRRTAAERANATIKDTATTNIARGWCRLTGLTPLTLWIACLLAVRNQRILAAWHARQADNAAPRRRRPAAPHPQTAPHQPRPARQPRHNHPAPQAPSPHAAPAANPPAPPARAHTC